MGEAHAVNDARLDWFVPISSDDRYILKRLRNQEIDHEICSANSSRDLACECE
jgi:hypothetical protein